MKTYIKPEIDVVRVCSSTAIANDPYDLMGGDGYETELSSPNAWWDDSLLN